MSRFVFFFLLMMWHDLKVQAGLEPHVLSVLCICKVKDVLWDNVDAAFFFF